MRSGQRTALVILVLAISLVTALLMLPAPQEGSKDGLEPLFPGLLPEDIARVELSGGPLAAPVVLELVDGDWALAAPRPAPADRTRVGMLLRAIVGLEVGAPIDDAQLDAYDLDSSTAPGVTMETAEGELHELRVGAETVTGGTYLLCEGRVRPAEGLVAQSLPTDADELRDRRLWTGSVLGSRGLAVTGVADWSMERADVGWRLVYGELPESFDAAGSPEAVLQLLSSARVHRFPTAPRELAAPLIELTVADELGAPSRLSFGPASSDGLHPAAVPFQDQIVLVEASIVEALVELVAGPADPEPGVGPAED